MDAVIVAKVMDDIGKRLDTIPGLRVLPYEADSVNPPCALVSLPAEIGYQTYQRGMDKMGIEVTILVSAVSDRVRRDQIAPYGDGAGPKSIKQVLETGTYTAFDIIYVSKGMFDVVNVEGQKYLAALFACIIQGSGN